MLPELVLHLTARTTPALRRLGLVGDAVALWSRATRRRRAWASHEARCHAVVARAVAALPHRRHVAILGSGLLRDVPVAALASAFERVILIDAVHLLPARRRARRLGAEMRLLDLTGMADRLAGHADGPVDGLAPLRTDPQFDLVVSANVLSQLPMALEAWAERHPEAPSGLADGAIARHLADLAGFACPVCLLTDVAHRRVAADGLAVETDDLLRGATLPEPDETWDWPVAPPGEIDRDAHVHRVHGYADLFGRRAPP